MSEPFLSEIRIFSFNYAPSGWALCNGQLLPITQNQALYALIGTTFGGDGTVNFALPNLQGRVPVHVGNSHVRGESAGEYVHTLAPAELAAHSHAANASSLDGDQPTPAGNVFAGTGTSQLYSSTATNLAPLMAGTLSTVGGSQAHQNTQPFLTLNFCIALQGVVPTQT
jgi:microcystin-dependent protein